MASVRTTQRAVARVAAARVEVPRIALGRVVAPILRSESAVLSRSSAKAVRSGPAACAMSTRRFSSGVAEGSDDDFAAIRHKYNKPDSSSQPKKFASPREEIAFLLSQGPVTIFMKGVPGAPRCGFSGLVAQILAEEGVQFPRDGAAVDILSTDHGHLREAVKEFTSWPTIPQVFIGGEFVGGADIMKQLFESGELTTLLEDAKKIAGKK